MAEGNEPRPSRNWIKFYDHVYQDTNVSLPNEYSELLCIGYATGSNVNQNVYTIVIDKLSYTDISDGAYIRTGFYQGTDDNGSFTIRKTNNTTINPRRVSFCGSAIDPTYIKLYYK